MTNMHEHRLLPLDEWATETDPPRGVDADCSFILNDPISGAPLDPEKPPAFLLEKVALRDGQGYLQDILSRQTALGVLYTPGESQYNDLGGYDDFEAIVRDPANNIQAVGHTLDGVVRNSDGRLVALSSAGSPYLERIRQAATPFDIAVFCMGLEVDLAGAPAGRTERALMAIADMAKLHRYEDDRSKSDLSEAVVRAIALHTMQSYNVLSAGEQMQHINAELQAKGGRLENAIALTPIKNADTARKFETMRMEDVGIQLIDPNSHTEDTEWDRVVMSKCRVDVTL